jgi:uncharacterized DUF497 family protein
VPALRFEWDGRKNAQNKRKHGITFEEAQTVFFDEHALLIADPGHSGHEERFILPGLSSGATIRLISARRADRQEREQYEVRWTL